MANTKNIITTLHGEPESSDLFAEKIITLLLEQKPPADILSEAQKFPQQINATDQAGNTLLHLSIKLNRYDVALVLTQQKDLNVNAQNKQGDTPLHLLLLKPSSNDKIQLLQSLLQQNADPNIANKNQQTALQVACSTQELIDTKAIDLLIQHIDLLIQHDAHCHLNIGDDEHPLVKRLQYLSTHERSNPLIFAATATGQTDSINDLLSDRSIKPHDISGKKTKKGNTLFLLTAIYGQYALNSWLIAKGFFTKKNFLEQRNNEGNTMLLLASENNQMEFIEWAFNDALISAQSFQDQHNDAGDTPIIIAARDGHIALINWAFQKNFVTMQYTKKHKNKKGDTAIHVAIRNKHHSIIELFIKNDLQIFSPPHTEYCRIYDIAVEINDAELIKHVETKTLEIFHETSFSTYDEEIFWIEKCHNYCPEVITQDIMVEAKVACYLQYEKPEEAYVFCMGIYSDTESFVVSARQTALTEIGALIFKGAIPFADNNHLFPDDTPDKIRNAIKAYEFATNCDLPKAKLLLEELDAALTEVELSNQHKNSIELLCWTQENLELFMSYYLHPEFKETVTDANNSIMLAIVYQQRFHLQHKDNLIQQKESLIEEQHSFIKKFTTLSPAKDLEKLNQDDGQEQPPTASFAASI